MTLYRFDQIADNIRIPVMPEPEDSERYIGLEHMDSGSLRIRRWGAPTTLIGQKLTMKEGDVLFARRNAYLRRVAVAPFDGVFSAHGMVLRAKTDVCLHEFLPVFMESDYFMERAIKISVGSLSPTINWSTLAGEEFTLPPLDEQRRIAALLWAADDVLQANKVVLEKVEILRLAFINDELGGFTSSVDMGGVCSKIVDGPHYPPSFTDKGIPFLLVSNLSSGTIDWDVSKWISEQSYKEIYPRINSEIGDVLYTVVGSFGVPVYVDWDKPFGFQRHVALLKPDRRLLDGHFLKYFLESNLGKYQANLRAVGLAQKTLTLGALKKFRIPKVDIEQQRRIVEKIRVVDTITKTLKDHVGNSVMVKKQLLVSSLGE